MMKKMIVDRSGGAPFVFLILFMMFMTLTGLVIDGGRFVVARGNLQTIADASSLAGAMTARIVPETELEVMEDTAGEPEGVKEVITGYNIVIDEQIAREAALDAAVLNSGNWESQGGIFDPEVTLKGDGPGWDGWSYGDDNYYTRARAWMKPGYFAVLMKAFSDKNHVPVYIDSQSRAYIVEPPTPPSDPPEEP